MEHELFPGMALGLLSNPLSSQDFKIATNPSRNERMSSLARDFLRHGAVENLETLFSRLKGGALLIAALSYGLGIPVADVCSVRVRDVNIGARKVVIKSNGYQIPAMVLDDLKEYLHDKLCGYEASVSLSKRDQPLFSESERLCFGEELVSWWRMYQSTQGDVGDSERSLGQSEEAGLGRCAKIVDRALSLLGRAHLQRAIKKNSRLSSALELFDKGPLIVRRGRFGAVKAYYSWRAQILSLQEERRPRRA